MGLPADLPACSPGSLPDHLPSFFLNNVEMTVRIETVSARETTDEVAYDRCNSMVRNTQTRLFEKNDQKHIPRH
jgi:uncharacterized cupin superfamily protein